MSNAAMRMKEDCVFQFARILIMSKIYFSHSKYNTVFIHSFQVILKGKKNHHYKINFSIESIKFCIGAILF